MFSARSGGSGSIGCGVHPLGGLDEVYVRINGVQHGLWCMVDHEGEVLESCVTKDRDKAAALEFVKKGLKQHGAP